MMNDKLSQAFPTMDSVDVKPPPYEATSASKAGVQTFVWSMRAIEINETYPGGVVSISDQVVQPDDAPFWMSGPPNANQANGQCAGLRLLLVFVPFAGDSIPDSDPADKYTKFELNERFLQSCGISVPTPSISHWIDGDFFSANRRYPFYHNGYEADADSCSRFAMGVDRQRLFVSHDSDTATTKAIYIFPEYTNNPDWVEFLVKSLKHSSQYLHHPLGIPALVAEIRFASRRSPIQTTITGEVCRLTQETGMGYYEKSPRNADDDAKWLPRHHVITDSLNNLIYNTAADGVRMSWLKQYVDYLVRYNNMHSDEIMHDPEWRGHRRRALVKRQASRVAYLLECLQDEIRETESIIDHGRETANLVLSRVLAMGAAYDLSQSRISEQQQQQRPQSRERFLTPSTTGGSGDSNAGAGAGAGAGTALPARPSRWSALTGHGAKS